MSGLTLLCWALTGVTAGDEILKAIDGMTGLAKDQVVVYEVFTKEPGKPERALVFETRMKGLNWRRIEFLAPGDVKGMRILVRSPTEMWVWLPAFRRVRRLASHVKEQGFMGTAIAHEEMSLSAYGKYFNGRTLEESDRHWKVEANKKPGAEVVFSKVVIEIRRDIIAPVKLEYFNARGMHAKTETRRDFLCKDRVCNPRLVKVVDHTRNNLTSRLERREWQFNTGVQDSFFTVRALQRGR